MRRRTLAPRRSTYLPNASTLAYGKFKASPGDYIIFREGPYSDGSLRDSFARVLGQIASCDSDGADCTGYLCVAAVSENLTAGFERWIAPSEVRQCWPAEHANRFMLAFLNASVAETLAGLQANSGILAGGKDGRLWTGSEAQS